MDHLCLVSDEEALAANEALFGGGNVKEEEHVVSAKDTLADACEALHIAIDTTPHRSSTII